MKASVAEVTLFPAVTTKLVLLLFELVFNSDGLQSSVPPPPGTNAIASTE
jgi:hypothetical protein